MDAVFSGVPCRLVLEHGRGTDVDTHAWSGEPSSSDEQLFLASCVGPTIDVGCGPGRLTGALAQRGVDALGTDISREAVRQTRARGARAFHGDVFEALPGAHQWRHVLLADGNIGIGGDPVRLLARVARLLHPTGSATVELAATGALRIHENVRLHVGGRASHPFAWATVGTGAIHGLAASAGLRVTGVERHDGRVAARLQIARSHRG